MTTTLKHWTIFWLVWAAWLMASVAVSRAPTTFPDKNGISIGNSSTTLPWTLRNNYFMVGDKAIAGQDVLQVDSDYNLYAGGGGSDFLTLGANDQNDGLRASSRPWCGPAVRVRQPADVFSLMLPSPLQGGGNSAGTIDLFGTTRPTPNSIGAVESYPTSPVGGLSAGTVIVGAP